ncbi:MAG TPA: hypothetical protein VJ739_00990 [Gemmataceae bacterium]|nr:hypothetical protein [Gemmataceae bacterium]
MHDLPILGPGDDRRLVKQFLSQYDVPAYVRRARQVEDAWEQVLHRCRLRRDEWLLMVRLRLGTLHGLAGSWEALAPLLADEGEAEVLRQLHETLQPRLRAPIRPTSSLLALRRALRELTDSLEHFNARWREFLPTVELDRVNAVRADYNRYYLLEKECAIRSPRLARAGFRRLEPLTTEAVAAALPVLPVPRLKD